MFPRRLYTPEANPIFGQRNTYTLLGGASASSGSCAALDPQTGGSDWQTAVPDNYAALGPVSVANGVTYGESTNPSPTSGADMFALNATTRSPLDAS